jgi:NADPH-dependent curcumin reductase
MHAVMSRMNIHGRMILCGLISSYTKDEPDLGSFSTVLVKRLRVQGFIILDYATRFNEAATQLGKWKMFGKLKDRETVIHGLENARDAINMLFAGGNTGKLLVKVSE